MIPDVGSLSLATLPDGEKLDAKGIAGKVQGMFMEMMLKTMEDSVGAEDGLFGNSSSAEIYRGMLREQMANAMSSQLQSPLNDLLQKKFDSAPPPTPDAPVVPETPGDSNGSLPVNGVITSPLGWRKDPISHDMRFHKGTDIAAAEGSDIRAVADGVVVESGVKGGYGNVVVVKTDDGRKMLYGHNQANRVAVGERVQRGEVIAQVGATGRATGPHVHFEVTE
jgi:murein DD-endopeptidase MepM/ murein hydrolase activator NlpD